MKKMLGYMMIAILGSIVCSSAHAAIDCHPGMGNCPDTRPDDGLSPRPIPSLPTQVNSNGYFEFPSPTCVTEEVEIAKAGAIAKAEERAKWELKSQNVVQISEPKFLALKCEKSIYRNQDGYYGNSWIASVVVKYARQ